MQKYIRFQTSIRSDETARPLGIFCAAGQLERTSKIDACARPWLEEALDWFNDNLQVPSLGESCRRAVFWFRSDAQRLVAKVWDVVAVLREAGVTVQLQRTDVPGKIVYQDAYQIAAIGRSARRCIRASFSNFAWRV